MVQLQAKAPDTETPDDAPAASSPNGVRSVQRAFALIRCFTTQHPEATLTELTQRTGLATSTVQRLLTTLEAASVLRRLPDGRYTFGSALLQVAVAALGSVELHSLVEPYLKRISSETGETANFAILDENGDVVYLRRTLSSQAIRYENWLGRTIPAIGTAIGAALTGLADENGLAIALKTIEPDVTAIAAPIHGLADEIVGAISITGPTFRIGDAALAEYGAVLAREARAISAQIGGHWPYEENSGGNGR